MKITKHYEMCNANRFQECVNCQQHLFSQQQLIINLHKGNNRGKYHVVSFFAIAFQFIKKQQHLLNLICYFKGNR